MVKKRWEHSYVKTFCKELRGTYYPMKEDKECHALMIQRLIHSSHNFAFDQCLSWTTDEIIMT
jgi:hypothetical protein